jgi:hypothetical protein
MSFELVIGNEITELLQLESPQSEFCNSGYKMNKSGRSAVFNRFMRLQCFGHNSLNIHPIILNLAQKISHEISELLQLDLLQSEFCSPR